VATVVLTAGVAFSGSVSVDIGPLGPLGPPRPADPLPSNTPGRRRGHAPRRAAAAGAG
jgi:hypothetical protein